MERQPNEYKKNPFKDNFQKKFHEAVKNVNVYLRGNTGKLSPTYIKYFQEPNVLAHTDDRALERWEQVDQEFKSILGCIVSSRPA